MITGPRQSGKTTFLREEFGQDYHYVTFDDPLQRQFAREDPNGFLDQFVDNPVILDEIQYVQELFSYIKIRIDNNRHAYGQFLMTGSQQFNLMKNISDSLAGRIAIFELLPFSSEELFSQNEKRSIQELIWYGGYPELLLHPESRQTWISSYIHTYIERDIRQLMNVRDLGQFEQFVTLLAANFGQELNLSRLSRSTGLSVTGCKKWIHLLNSAYLTYTLQPYYNNFGKRLVKTPKLYFLDTALAAYLTRQPSLEAAWQGAMGGAFFEGWIITDFRKQLISEGIEPNIYFWRSRDGVEVDLILEMNNQIIPIEIKQTSTPNSGHTKGLQKFCQFTDSKCLPGLLVCNVPEKKALPYGVQAIPWWELKNNILSMIL